MSFTIPWRAKQDNATKRWVFSANAIERYAFILVTTPAPPILPPSRIAKRNRSFIAIEATSFTLNVAVEQLPGLHGVVSNFKSVRHAFRFGSLADIRAVNCDVRFTPESGHLRASPVCAASHECKRRLIQARSNTPRSPVQRRRSGSCQNHVRRTRASRGRYTAAVSILRFDNDPFNAFNF
jgi:hypothetical protein